MDKEYSAGAMALASWALLNVLLVHMKETGALTDETRRDLMDRALRAVEGPRPQPGEKDLTEGARRLLEEWM
ncbi:hypothetical protein [Falsiroseomonas sp.]|uniref:hypothetical protein n=1 Tax=Falsiroseomonas sp. TaxID=2870721 RepID=UPI003F71E3FF